MIYEDNEIKRVKSREYMRKKTIILLIQFRKEEKLEILQPLLDSVHNFIIVDDCSALGSYPRTTVIRTRCNSENIKTIIDKISNERFELLESVEDAASEDCQYIVFTKVLGIPLRDDVDNLCRYVFLSSYRFGILSYITLEYKVHTVYFFNQYLVIEMTLNGITIQEDIKVYENNKLVPDCYILTLLGGLGDDFNLFSIIYEFIQQKKLEGSDVYILMPSTSEVNRKYHQLFYQNEKLLFFDSESMIDWWYRFLKPKNYIDLKHCFSKGYKDIHICDLAKIITGISADFNPYKHNTILKKIIYDDLSPEEIRYIDELTHYSHLIGLQYFSGYYVSSEETQVANTKKNWSPENVKRFIEICQMNGYTVLTLNPNPYPIQLDSIQLKNVKVAMYAYVISKCKLLVGVDSSAGHIASFYNIPSITIWGENSPLESGGVDISFRVLRKNYSIWAKDKNINMITPELVFNKVQEFMSGSLRLPDNMITYADTVNYKDMEVL